MNRICNYFSPELDTQEDDDQNLSTSAPIKEVVLKDADITSSCDLVPLTSSPSSQPTRKKRPAPAPPYNSVSLASSSSSQPKTKKRPAPAPPYNSVSQASSLSSQPTTKNRPAPAPPSNSVPLASSP